MSELNIKYDYADAPTLYRFASSNARFRGIMGPFRSGKSSASIMEIVSRGVHQRKHQGVAKTRWIVVRNTFRMLEDSTIRSFHMWLPPSQFGTYKSSDHTYLIKAFPGVEIDVWFRALDRPEHVSNLLSVEVTGAWVNEAKEVPWAIIDALDGRIGQYPPKMFGGPSWFGMWADTNPPDTDSAWYKYWEERRHDPAMAQLFKQPSGRSTIAENLSHLPSRDYYTSLAYGKSDDWIKVFIDGDYGFIAEGRAVYSEYHDNIHCREVEPVAGVPVIRGWDFGLTPACTFSQILPDGRWLTFDEMTTENFGIDQFSDEVLEHCATSFGGRVQFEDLGDPAGQERAQTDMKTCYEILWSKGIAIEPSIQDPRARQESVRYLLRNLGPATGEPRFILHPRCRVLRKGFNGGYFHRRLQVTGDRYTAKPDKNKFSHPHDALQYSTVKYFGNRSMESDPDDMPWDDFGQHGLDDSTRSRVTGY